ncbi:DUF1269 domain-containing protein [Nocardia zapadnayensis]|uniref:DUF1269 domain-containing protein n=1 Tax=Nocardia rhamnosiphila TaxID=426716 RepID=UPI0022467226|nr:DUF1269 domain-containing protein [Nocardia zapadnayensis]MCX0272410.1 DUF1269 domain-containing protein [Nocardia zapadnayensis]
MAGTLTVWKFPTATGAETAVLTPGTSALFALTSDATVDRVHEAFHGQSAELVSTNLSHEQEATLREVFAD